MPDGKETPRPPDVVVLYCRRAVSLDFDPHAKLPLQSDLMVKTVMLPCSSKVELPNILSLLEKGADAVQILGCPEEHCQFLTGSRLATRRVERARKLLSEVGMGSDRVGIERRTVMTAGDLADLAEKRVEAVRPLGPNPMRGEIGT